MNVVAGMDIGGTNTRFGLVDESGKIIVHDSVSTTAFPDANDLVKLISERILAEVKSTKSELKGIGIGAPNGNYFKGTIEFAPNLKWKGIIPLAKYFEEQLHVPAVLTNDANAAAIGELYFGGAKGMKDFIFIT